MLIVRNHKLNEDYIENISDDVVKQDSVEVLAPDEEVFTYLFDYPFQNQKIKDNPTLITGIFNRIYKTAHTLMHIGKVISVYAIVREGNGSDARFEYEKNSYVPAMFASLVEMICQTQISNDNFYRITDWYIGVEFVPAHVSFKQYLREYMRICDLCISPFAHKTYTGVKFQISTKEIVDLAGTNVTEMYSSYYHAKPDTLKKIYKILFGSDSESLDKETLNMLTYRSQRMSIVTKLVYIRDNPNLYRGFNTKVYGMLQSSGTDAEDFFHIYVYLGVEPTSGRYVSGEAVMNIGKSIINGLNEAMIHNLTPNQGRSAAFFKVFIHVPEEISRKLDRKNSNWVYEHFITDRRIWMMVVLFNDDYEYYKDGAMHSIIVGKDAPEEMERLQKQFQSIYDKEKREARQDRRD